jgi:hypothetical protein
MPPPATEERGAWVITDSAVWAKAFDGHPHVFGALKQKNASTPQSALAVGGWFDGEGWNGKHLLVRDLGTWPNGLGPKGVAGATMMRTALWPESLSDALEARTDELKAAAFRGLVSVDLQLGQEEPLFQPTGQWQAGWPMMHTHAFGVPEALHPGGSSERAPVAAALQRQCPEHPHPAAPLRGQP